MKRYRCLLIGMFVLASLALRAQIPTGYYNNAEGKTGDALKTALHDIIKGHTVHGYSSLNNIYAYTDCYSDGKIWDIYSNKHWSLSSACGNYSGEGDCWNKEHTWPSSWFNDKNTPRCDLFHVMPTDGYVNNRRSNYPYGEVGNATWTSSNGSKLGSCSTTGYSGTVFEPVDEYKGDIARNFFYMSVRYYGEDSGWGTSGMTNKSTILDWAMTMLLRWHEADPVSDKEIARNNAVYGYQNNRNPFIDHPEYARMIWDPNYTPAATYAITCASNLSHGSVTAPTSAAEGSTVAIIATPDAGYMVSSYSVCSTDSPTTTVTVSSNGTFTMPAYNVTVSATFEVNNTYYNIALGTVSHGSISVSANSALSGTTVTMTATPDDGYSLYSWYVYKTNDINTSVYTGTMGSFVMPAFDVTVMATFVQSGSGGGNGDYVKVTSAPTDWSGEYLIVNESYNKAFNGSLSTLDANNNTISVTITSNTIPADETTNAAAFTIASMTGGYSIKGTSGKYIGYNGSSNGLTASNNALANTISLSNGVVVIKGTGTSTLQYNNSADRFRYYGSSQQPIQLYKKTATAPTPTPTIHFDNNGGTGSMLDQTVNEFEATALNANTFTREGFEFDGWNTEANGTGTYYADGANITLTDDITLYAQWDPKYDITVVQPEQHGTISASHSAAVEGTTVTLTATPEAEYGLKAWTVTDGNGNTIDVVENQFEMPADNVTVTARFWYVGVAQVSYHLATSADELVAGEKYLIVNTANNKALGTAQNNNNRSAADVTITNNVINSISSTVCELELGGSTGTWTLFDAGYSNGTGGYLYAASSDANQLKTRASNSDGNSQWTITVTTAGVATITAQGSNTHNIIKYNPNTSNNNPIFSCYVSGQQDVSLFRRVETHPTPVEQPLTLNAGWNWWSTYVELSNLDGLTLLETAMGTDGMTISSQSEGSAMYNANQGQWMSGFSNNLITGHMYQIQLANPVEGSLEGLLANPADHPVTLVTGWNWLGYPLNVTMELNAALVNLTATPGDVIKYQNAFATYYEGYGWFGTLKNLVPGQGYMYHTDATVSKTFTFPTGQ